MHESGHFTQLDEASRNSSDSQEGTLDYFWNLKIDLPTGSELMGVVSGLLGVDGLLEEPVPVLLLEMQLVALLKQVTQLEAHGRQFLLLRKNPSSHVTHSKNEEQVLQSSGHLRMYLYSEALST